MVDFGGWDMPVEYSGISEEHLAVRAAVGLFDVSHMGEIELAGSDALATLQWLTTNDASKLSVGQAQYSALSTPAGTFVDDVIVYRLATDHFLLVVNASNIVKDYRWILDRSAERGGDVAVVNASSRYALIALQGPAAVEVLRPLATVDLDTLKYYWFAAGEVAGLRATVFRTGYTGEDGFEVLVPPIQAARLWDALIAAGSGLGLKPCGLGARDTLRLEACMRLYGNEMDETVTVLEAGLDRFVGWNKGAFLGRDVLDNERARGVRRRIVAFEMIERGIARHGCAVLRGDEQVGVVTSGTQTPYLKKAVGLAMVPIEMAETGTTLVIDIRGRRTEARVVPEPFYVRPRRKSPHTSPPLRSV
jgi:aminomethyltransferase